MNQISLQDVLKMGIQIGVETALKEISAKTNENIRNREDRRLHNTKLLLENYRILKIKCLDNPVKIDSKNNSPMQILEDIESLIDTKKETLLESVQKSFERTLAMIAYIEHTAKLYKTFAAATKIPEESRKYTIMVLSYMSKVRYTNEDISLKLHIDASTVSRNKSDAIKTYSRFLWGVDNLKLINRMHKRRT